MGTNLFVKPIKRPINWSDIKLLLFDCDGVLTDGRIIYGNNNQDLKHFHAHDGMGFNLLRNTDIQVGFITGRSSEALEHRCRDLNISILYQGVPNKLRCVEELLPEMKLDFRNIVFMGDDWNDVPVMRKAAFSAAPANAFPEVQKIADWVSSYRGGQGAVRELINYVLQHKGIYEKTVLKYLESIQ